MATVRNTTTTDLLAFVRVQAELSADIAADYSNLEEAWAAGMDNVEDTIKEMGVTSFLVNRFCRDIFDAKFLSVTGFDPDL